MEQIKSEFKANGYDYRLILREGVAALYEQLDKGEVVGYEVHKVRVKAATTCKYNDRVVERPAREILASNEEFGSYGFSYATKESAMNKFNALVV